MAKGYRLVCAYISMVKLEFLKGTHTESEPLESDLSFEEICPIWSKKLKNGIDEIDRMILVQDSKYCVVGEAWDFQENKQDIVLHL